MVAFPQNRDVVAGDDLPKEIKNAPDDLFRIKLDTLSIAERISVRTNLVEWAIMSPNVMVEFDVLPYNWSKWTVALGGRYNDFAKDILSPRNVFNIKTFRAEVRRYWHTTYYGGSGVPKKRDYYILQKDSIPWNGLRKLLSRQRKHPREEKRAYYVGAFASVSDFSIKLGKKGKQGKAMMLGFDFGFQQPLYGYGSGNTIDLELGVSAGVAQVEYDTYKYNSEYNCYPRIGEKTKEFVPALSEVRLALVYRFGRSSRERYNERYRLDASYERRLDSLYTAADLKKMEKKRLSDSITLAKRENDSLESLRLRSPLLYEGTKFDFRQDGYAYSKDGYFVSLDTTEFGRMLRTLYVNEHLLREAEKVSPERYRQVSDSIAAAKKLGKSADSGGKMKGTRKKKSDTKMNAGKKPKNERADKVDMAQPLEDAPGKEKHSKRKDKRKKNKEDVVAPVQQKEEGAAEQTPAKDEKGGAE